VQVLFLVLFAYWMIQFGMFLQSRQKHSLADDLSESARDYERDMKERGELLSVFDDCESFVRSVALLWRASHTSLEKVRSISFQVRELEEMIPDIVQEIKNKTAKNAIDAAA